MVLQALFSFSIVERRSIQTKNILFACMSALIEIRPWGRQVDFSNIFLFILDLYTHTHIFSLSLSACVRACVCGGGLFELKSNKVLKKASKS